MLVVVFHNGCWLGLGFVLIWWFWLIDDVLVVVFDSDDGRVKEAVIRSNGVTKMLLVMHSEKEGIVRKIFSFFLPNN